MGWKKGIDDYRRDVEQYEARISSTAVGNMVAAGTASIKRCGGWSEVYGLRI